MRTLLALDPGETTGFALFTYHGQGAPVLMDYGTVPLLASGIDGLLGGTQDWLDNYRSVEHLEVAFEGPLTAYSVRTKIELHEVRGTMRAWCLRHAIPYASYHPATVKACVTGNGAAKKAQVALAVRKLFNLPRIATDHASDAIAIGVTHYATKHKLTFGGQAAKDIGSQAIVDDRRQQAQRRSTSGGGRRGRATTRTTGHRLR